MHQPVAGAHGQNDVLPAEVVEPPRVVFVPGELHRVVQVDRLVVKPVGEPADVA